MDAVSKFRHRVASRLKRRPSKGLHATTSEAFVEIPDEIPNARSRTFRTTVTNPENRLKNLNASEVGLVNEIRVREKESDLQKIENEKLKERNDKLQQDSVECQSELSKMRSLYDQAVEEVNHLTKERDTFRKLVRQVKREKDSQLSDLKKERWSLQHQMNRLGGLMSEDISGSLGSIATDASALRATVSTGALTWEASKTINEGSENESCGDLVPEPQNATSAYVLSVAKRLDSLDMQRRNLWEKAERGADSTRELGTIFLNKGDAKIAAQFFTMAADFREKFLGNPKHPDLFPMLEHLANALAKDGQWSRLEQCANRLLDFPQCRDSPEQRLQVMMKFKGKALQHQGKKEEHEAIHLDMLRLCDRENISGALIPLSASVRCALSMIYLENKDFQRASLCVEEAVKICSNNLTPNSAVMQSVIKIHQTIRANMENTVAECPTSAKSTSVYELPKTFVLAPAPPGKNRRSSSNT